MEQNDPSPDVGGGWRQPSPNPDALGGGEKEEGWNNPDMDSAGWGAARARSGHAMGQGRAVPIQLHHGG